MNYIPTEDMLNWAMEMQIWINPEGTCICKEFRHMKLVDNKCQVHGIIEEQVLLTSKTE